MNIALLILASLFIPQGNEDTLVSSPLERGEVAYIADADGKHASLRIGKDDSQNLEVRNRAALQGFMVKEIDRMDYVVQADGATYNATTDTWSWSNPTSNQLYSATLKAKYVVMQPSNLHNAGFKCKFSYPAQIGGEGEVTADVTYDGKEVRMSARMPLAGLSYFKLTIEQINTCEFGDETKVTDLNDHIFNVIDSIGLSSLTKWRSYCIHYHDGNYGDDWSAYGASNHVSMLQSHLRFGANNNGIHQFEFGINPATTNEATMMVNGGYAVKFYSHPSTYVETGNERLVFTSITASNSYVVLGVGASNITNFASSNLKLYYADQIAFAKSDWRIVDPSGYTVAGTAPAITITIAKSNAKQGFYQLRYGDDYAIMEICDVVKIHKLVIKGEDSKWYRITVNGGVISATEFSF